MMLAPPDALIVKGLACALRRANKCHRFAAFAACRASDADLHARSRILGARVAGDECFVVRMRQKEDQTRHGSSFTGGIVPKKLSSP
jgi:hypothetical protein